MLRSLSRAHCALASSLLVQKLAEPPAKWSVRAERRHTQRRAGYRADRGSVTRCTRPKAGR